MSDVQITSLAGALSLMLFVSSMMYFIGRQKAAALLVVATVVVSISTRVVVAFFITASDNYGGLFYLMVDSILAIPFCFSVWIPALLKSSLSDNSYHHSGTFTSPMEPISDGLSMESFTINDLSDMFEGDKLSQSQIKPPTRPSRRGRVTVFYEGIFLMIALIFWPTSIITLVAFGSPDFMAQTPFSDFGSGNASGKMVLAILYSISCLSTFGVYRYDRDARDGPLYAKSIAAYHENMDHYIGMEKAYYELQARKIEVATAQVSSQNEN
jgi:hypothetical protein